MNALRVVRSIEASNCNRRSDLQFVAVLSPISQKTDNKLIDAPSCPLLLFPVTEGLIADLTAEIPSLDPKQPAEPNLSC